MPLPLDPNGKEMTPEAALRSQLADRDTLIADLQKKLGIREQSTAEKLAAIENLSHADLKASKADLVERAAQLPAGDLAARYVQSRTDAKLRDERMGEMGKQISSLQAQVEDQAKQIEQLQDDITKKDSTITTHEGTIAIQLQSAQDAAKAHAEALEESRAKVAELTKTLEAIESAAQDRNTLEG